MKDKATCETTLLTVLKRFEPFFGNWVLKECLGTGSLSCVFKIAQQAGGRDLFSALKVIPLENANSGLEMGKTLGKRIMDSVTEILHLSELASHPNLVNIHNFETYRYDQDGKESALLCIMMEYVPHCLKDILEKSTLPIDRAVRVLEQCCRGLEFIHVHKVIHRDIKPGNIFVTGQGYIKIGDFGIARSIAKPPKNKEYAGTFRYIAPEVLNPSHGPALTPAVDIYSLALVGYFMLSGHLPFEAPDRSRKQALALRLRGEPIPPLPGVPGPLMRVLLTALAANPAQRIQTAQAFREALEQQRK